MEPSEPMPPDLRSLQPEPSKCDGSATLSCLNKHEQVTGTGPIWDTDTALDIALFGTGKQTHTGTGIVNGFYISVNQLQIRYRYQYTVFMH